MALSKTRPPFIVEHEGLVSANGFHIGNGVYFLAHAGVPTGGDGWAGPGSMVIDYTNFDVYINTNTLASPTWTKKVD